MQGPSAPLNIQRPIETREREKKTSLWATRIPEFRGRVERREMHLAITRARTTERILSRLSSRRFASFVGNLGRSLDTKEPEFATPRARLPFLFLRRRRMPQPLF